MCEVEMQEVAELIQVFSNYGIRLWTEGGELCFDAPEGVLSDEKVSLLRENKAAIIAHLLHVPLADRIPVASRVTPLVLSTGQQRLWFLDQLEGATGAYNICGAVSITGPIDTKHLEYAITSACNRHEALRTVFRTENELPCQVVLSNVDVPIRRETLKSADRNQICSWIRCFGDEPFDLSVGPLIRVAILNIDADTHVVAVTIHHIVSDGWSSEIFLTDLCQAYVAAVNAEPQPAIPLRLHFADYAAWEQSASVRERRLRGASFFREMLQDAPRLLELPLDHARPSLQTFRGNSFEISISDTVRNLVHSVARTRKCTEFMAWHSIVSVLLARLSGQRDIVIGIPVANRPDPELERVVGFFASSIVVRSRFADNPTFLEALSRSQQTLLKAYEYQDLPFEQLVEILQPERTLSHNPIFQVMMAWQNAPQAQRKVGGLSFESLDIPDSRSIVDLSFTFTPRESELLLKVTWARDLFEESTVRGWCQHLEVLATSLAREPELPVLKAVLLSETERDRILYQFNDTEKDFPLEKPLHQFISEQCKRTPSDTAVTFEGSSLTYAQLDHLSNHLAQKLRDAGVRIGTFVGVCALRSINLPVALIAILKSGGAYVPLDPDYPVERLRFMIEDAGAPFLIVDRLSVGSISQSDSTLLILEDLLEKAPDSATAIILERELTGSDLAYMIYTSGSTGRPKGAMNTHAGIVNRILWNQESFKLEPCDAVLQKTPFSFDVSVWEFFWPLMQGARLVMAQPGGHRDPDYLVETIVTEQITTIHFVPSMLQVFLEARGVELCTSLRLVFCSGEALPIALQHRYFSRCTAALHNVYGPTEAAVDVTHWECVHDLSATSVPIGRPISNICTYVLDEFLQPVPLGVVGELYLGGIGVGRGYYNRPELSTERFIPNPFSSKVLPSGVNFLYRTGDLARIRRDGAIEYLGRTDFQIKLRGFRIEIGEIENVILQFDGVKEAVVVVENDTTGMPLLAAFYVPKKGATVVEAQLRSFLNKRLPEYMVPSYLNELETMPLSSNGKVSRGDLPRRDRGVHAEIRIIVSLETEIERIVAQEWKRSLSLDEISRDDNFFTLGGHSLLATRVCAHLSETLGIHVGVRCLFLNPVLREYAAAIEQLQCVSISNRDDKFEELTI